MDGLVIDFSEFLFFVKCCDGWQQTKQSAKKNHSLFFSQRKRPWRVFCSVIKVTFMLEKWKLELFALRNTFSMVQIDNRALFERYCSCFSRLNEDLDNQSQRKRLMIDTNLSIQSLIVKQSISKKKIFNLVFFIIQRLRVLDVQCNIATENKYISNKRTKNSSVMHHFFARFIVSFLRHFNHHNQRFF
jgi:hypothetical protein